MRRRGAARAGRGATLLLALAVAALAYANWRVMELEIDVAPAAAEAGPAQTLLPPDVEPPAEPPPLTQFAEVVQRPLFTVGRRPPEASQESAPEATDEATAAAAADAAPPELQLVGIAIGGGKRQALLRQPGEGEEWVREGDSFAGWRVESVQTGGIVLGLGEQSRTISLYPARDTAAQ